MVGKIQTLLDKYQQKYPLYTIDAITEIMLNDGVITSDIAAKIKEGVSLFTLDNDFSKISSDNNDISMTQIMGGDFSSEDNIPETHFNRKIESTSQSKKQGDCWLLSDINALNYTEWGRKAISNSIVPDNDNSGGVTIKFKGSPIEQKEFHFTASQIEAARKSGNYSDGDDDMIAFELATEQTFTEMVKQGIAKSNYTDDEKQKNGLLYIHGGISTDDYNQYPISKLLGIDRKEAFFIVPDMKEKKDTILKLMSQKNNDIATACSFDCLIAAFVDPDTRDDNVVGQHAYAIKSFQYGQDVTITNPWKSGDEIKIPWQFFTEHLSSVHISCKNKDTATSIQNLIPKNHIQNTKKYIDSEECRKIVADRYQQEIEELEEISRNKFAKSVENHKQEIENKKAKITELLDIAIKSKDNKKLSQAILDIDSDIVVDILDKFPDLIKTCSEVYSGRNNRKHKCLLISNIVASLSKKAGTCCPVVLLGEDTVGESIKKCNRELNSVFYINENVIQEEITNLVHIIKQYNNKSSFGISI